MIKRQPEVETFVWDSLGVSVALRPDRRLGLAMLLVRRTAEETL